MKDKYSFVTIFTDTENFHLVKDVGQVPYFMYKTEGFDAELVTYKNNKDYPYLDNEVKGLKLKFIPDNGRFWYFEKSIVKYLLSSSKKIDVLNLFHFKKDNILYLLIYKTLNPKGKAYIKLDMDILFFRDYNAFLYSKYAIKNYLLKGLTKSIFRLTDVFSVETEDAREYLLKVYPELGEKLICLPNGVDNLYIDKEIPLKPFIEKENIILTVGRIGTVQKNTELFLESLLHADLKDWKVYILGPVETSFKQYIEEYFQKNPHLKESVIFTGNISCRKELFGWYNRSKVFCLTSRFEGFPITFPEALYFGNYIISTPVSSASHITANGEYGAIVKAEPKEVARALENCIQEGFLNQQRYEEIRSFSKDNFTWPGLIKKLSAKLKT